MIKKNEDGTIEDGYKINDNKVLFMKIVESPSFQFSITQYFIDTKENDRLESEGLPHILPDAIALGFTHPEIIAIGNFINAYLREYLEANNLVVQNSETR